MVTRSQMTVGFWDHRTRCRTTQRGLQDMSHFIDSHTNKHRKKMRAIFGGNKKVSNWRLNNSSCHHWYVKLKIVKNN